MTLYELAKKVNLSELADHQSKVIWSSGNGVFAYMIKLEDTVYLRVSFSQAQMIFYVLIADEWVDITSDYLYKEITELWKLEKAQLA